MGEGPEQQLCWNRELRHSCVVALLKPQVTAGNKHHKAVCRLQKMLGGGQSSSSPPRFSWKQVLLSPSVVKVCLLTSVSRRVFRVSLVGCDHKPDYRAYAQPVFSGRASAISVFVLLVWCARKQKTNLCQSLPDRGCGRRDGLAGGQNTCHWREGNWRGKACCWRRFPDCGFAEILCGVEN